MSDTLTYLLESIKINQEHGVDLIQKVDSFYNNAWTKLIYFITIGFAIVGIIVPLLIQWLQKKTLKASEESLKKEILTSTSKIKDEISKELIGDIEEKFKEYKKEIKVTRASANAKLFLTEGKVDLSKNYYDNALTSFIASARNCIDSDDYPTLSDVLKLLSEDCLPYLSIEEIDDLKTRYDLDLNSFFKDLGDIDDKLIFKEIIGEMRVTISKLPKTKKDKPGEQSKLADVF